MDTIERPPLNCGQETARASSEDNTRQNKGKEHWNTEINSPWDLLEKNFMAEAGIKPEIS